MYRTAPGPRSGGAARGTHDWKDTRHPPPPIRPSLDETVADSHHGFDLMTSRPELGPKAADVDVDRPRLDSVPVAPHTFEQTIPRQDPRPVLDQTAQQLELPPRQPHRLSVDAHCDRVEVRGQQAAAIHRRAGGAAASTQHGADPGRQFPQAERFREVVVGPEIE